MISACFQKYLLFLPAQGGSQPSVIQFQHGQKCFLRNFYVADLAHSFLPFLLFFQEFPFSGNIAAIAFGGYILAHGTDVFAGDNFGADCGLNGDLELLAG